MGAYGITSLKLCDPAIITVEGHKSFCNVKWPNMRGWPYTSLCVDRRDPPYAAVILSGVITEVDRPVYEVVSSMALRYYGEKEGQEFADSYRANPLSTVAFGLTPYGIVQNVNP